MTLKIVNNPLFYSFIDVSMKYCTIIENRNKLSPVKFLQEIYKVLPLLCYYGMQLSYIPSAKLIHRRQGRRTKEWKVIYFSLLRKLKKYDLYLEIFDPYDFKDNKPIHGSLVHDLSDIYLDLSIGVHEWKKSNSLKRKNIAYEWWIDHHMHWGEHAVSAFRAIFYLLFDKIKDKDGIFPIGIGQSKNFFLTPLSNGRNPNRLWPLEGCAGR
jgi:hypothetical protein